MTNKTLAQLISTYEGKLVSCDRSIEKLGNLLREAVTNDSISVEDVLKEQLNARHDRRMYVEFLRGLESAKESLESNQSKAVE